MLSKSTAAVLIAAFVTIGASAVGLVALKADGETIALALATEGAAFASVLAFMKALRAPKGDSDA